VNATVIVPLVFGVLFVAFIVKAATPRGRHAPRWRDRLPAWVYTAAERLAEACHFGERGDDWMDELADDDGQDISDIFHDAGPGDPQFDQRFWGDNYGGPGEPGERLPVNPWAPASFTDTPEVRYEEPPPGTEVLIPVQGDYLTLTYEPLPVDPAEETLIDVRDQPRSGRPLWHDRASWEMVRPDARIPCHDPIPRDPEWVWAAGEWVRVGPPTWPWLQALFEQPLKALEPA
jgi:hypothetical protein